MGFRFRKTISILPGLRLNFSKGGISTSIGRPGATINIGKRGVRGTVGLPGTGLSYSDMIVGSGENLSLGYASKETVERSGTGRRILVLAACAIGLVLLLLLVLGLTRGQSGSEPVGFQPRPVEASATGQREADDGTDRTTEGDDEGFVHSDEGVNCRAHPNAHGAVVTVLTGKENLTLVGHQAEWSRVTTEDQDCWVSSRLVH